MLPLIQTYVWLEMSIKKSSAKELWKQSDHTLPMMTYI